MAVFLTIIALPMQTDNMVNQATKVAPDVIKPQQMKSTILQRTG